jgi:hypothetical protein
VNERVLRRLWLGGAWPRGLPRTSDGAPLQVVYPGRPGHGAGPDLLDAIVALLDGRLVHGDVELHVRASDWRAHGHDGDPRYARVALHVVWRDDLGGEPAPAGRPAMQTVELGGLPAALLFERLRAPCRPEEPYHEWVRRLSRDELAGLVERLGDERLEARALRIGADLHALGPGQALHRALCDALGYAQNRPAFGTLAELAPADELGPLARASGRPTEAVEIVTAHLFARSGLLDEGPVGRVPDAAGRALAERYRSIVGRPPGERLAPGAWETVGVRPANRPARRLAALAALAVRTRDDGLVAATVEALRLSEPRRGLARLVELVRVAAGDDYWSWHHDFGRRLPGAPLAPLGDARTGAILANGAVPFALALADATDDEPLAEAARAVWRIAPGGGPNWISGQMRALLGGVSLASARREQGAIELYRRCCEERRCATCPSASVANRGVG